MTNRTPEQLAALLRRAAEEMEFGPANDGTIYREAAEEIEAELRANRQANAEFLKAQQAQVGKFFKEEDPRFSFGSVFGESFDFARPRPMIYRAITSHDSGVLLGWCFTTSRNGVISIETKMRQFGAVGEEISRSEFREAALAVQGHIRSLLVEAPF